LLGLLAGGVVVQGQKRETLACVARLELPECPALARAARVEGLAETTFTVRNDGSLESVVVAAPNGELKHQIERLLAESKFSRNCAGANLVLRVKFSLHPPRTKFGSTKVVLVAPDLIEVTSNLPDIENHPSTTDRDASSPR
jgi:hypothetical protein